MPSVCPGRGKPRAWEEGQSLSKCPPWSVERLEQGCTHLLQLEDVLVEVVLQLFVGVVDAELLEAVPLEVLKAKDVEDPDGQALGDRAPSQQAPPWVLPTTSRIPGWRGLSFCSTGVEPPH